MGIRRKSERGFQATLIDLARLGGWAAVHFRPARVLGKGGVATWRTAVQGDGKGWLDTILVKDRLIVCELKTPEGRLTPEQKAWVARLQKAGVEVYVWDESCWDEIERVLGVRRA